MISKSPDYRDSLLAHQGQIRTIVKRIAKNEGDVDDLSQECCLKIIEKEQLWDARRGGLTQWFNTLTRHLTRSLVARKRHEASLQGVADPLSDEDTLESCISHENIKWVLNQFKTLPDMQRKVLHLKYFEDKTMTAIAQELSITQPTASIHHKRALSTLNRRARSQGLLALLFPWKWNWGRLADALMANSLTQTATVVGALCVIGYGGKVGLEAYYGSTGSFLATPVVLTDDRDTPQPPKADALESVAKPKPDDGFGVAVNGLALGLDIEAPELLTLNDEGKLESLPYMGLRFKNTSDQKCRLDFYDMRWRKMIRFEVFDSNGKKLERSGLVDMKRRNCPEPKNSDYMPVHPGQIYKMLRGKNLEKLIHLGDFPITQPGTYKVRAVFGDFVPNEREQAGERNIYTEADYLPEFPVWRGRVVSNEVEIEVVDARKAQPFEWKETVRFYDCGDWKRTKFETVEIKYLAEWQALIVGFKKKLGEPEYFSKLIEKQNSVAAELEKMKIDFDKKQVVVIFMGKYSSSKKDYDKFECGKIVSVEEKKERAVTGIEHINVSYRALHGESKINNVIYPMTILVMDKTDKPIRFEKVTTD